MHSRKRKRSHEDSSDDVALRGSTTPLIHSNMDTDSYDHNPPHMTSPSIDPPHTAVHMLQQKQNLPQLITHPPQYATKWQSLMTLAYKRQRCLDGSIHVLIAPTTFPIEEMVETINSPKDTANIFSAFPTFPFENPDSFIKAFSAVDSKADTLTLGQMLKDQDAKKFLVVQNNEIQLLHKMNIFATKPIHTLPSNAKLLSSFWSYRCKWSPIGNILKYKVQLCVSGSQQELDGTIGRPMLLLFPGLWSVSSFYSPAVSTSKLIRQAMPRHSTGPFGESCLYENAPRMVCQ